MSGSAASIDSRAERSALRSSLLQLAPVRVCIAFLVFAAVSVLLFLPLVRDLNSAVLFEPGDLSSTARDYWAAEQHGESPFTFEHDTLIFAPEGQERAPSLQVANAVQPAFVLALDGVAGLLGALNLYMLLGFILTAALMFALLDRLRLHPLASGFGAFAFGFSWMQYEQAFFGHIGLNHIWVLPLLVLELLWLRRSRDWIAAGTVAVTLGFSFYVFSYLGLFASALVAAFMLVDLVDRSARGVRLQRLRRYALVWIGAYGMLFPALLASYLMPTGFTSSFAFTKEYFSGASVTDYLLPSVNHPVLGRLVEGDSFPPHAGEKVVFFGWSVLALALVAAVVRWPFSRRGGTVDERTFVIRLALVLVVTGFICSLPAYAHVQGRRIPLPDAAFVVGSFVNWWKIYSRFAVLAGLGLCVLAAVGVHLLLRRRNGLLAGAAVSAILVFELLPGAPVAVTPLDKPSPAVAWLEAHPRGTVAHYPMLPYWEALGRGSASWSARVWTTLYDQTRHGHPLYAVQSLPMNGTREEAIRLVSRRLDKPLTPRVLRSEGVRYVVVDEAAYDDLGQRPPRVHRAFRPLAQFGRTRIYGLRAGPRADVETVLQQHAAAIAAARGIPQPQFTLSGAFHPKEDYKGVPARWVRDGLTLDVRATESIVPTRYQLVLHGFSNRVLRRVEVRSAGRVIGSTVVDLPEQRYTVGPLHLPPGRSTLEVRFDPGATPLGGSDDRSATFFLLGLGVEVLPYVEPASGS